MKKATGKSNLSIIKDYLEGNRPFTQISMAGVEEISNIPEGHEWEDSNGKRWKKINGRKVSINKTAKILNEERCSICNNDVRWGTKYDKQVWPKTRKCYDCFIEFETQLKIKGLYESYQRNRDLLYLNGALTEFKNKLIETIDWCNDPENKQLKYFNDDGTTDIEVWKDDTDSIEKIKTDALNDLSLVNNRLDDIKNELSNLNLNNDEIKKTELQLKEKYKDGRDNKFPTIEILNK